MQIGWILYESEYLYFDSSGKQVFNRWVGDYYLLENGQRAGNQWVGESYVDENGKKDAYFSRSIAKHLNIEGLSISGYDFVNSYAESDSIRMVMFDKDCNKAHFNS